MHILHLLQCLKNALHNIVNKTKILGVILDDRLTWKDHISHISQKLAKSIGIILLVRKVLNQKSLLQLYYALIYPYLYYGNTIWEILRKQPYGQFLGNKNGR